MTIKPILPPAVFYASGIVSLVLHIVLPGVTLIHYPFTLLGIVFILFGGVLNIWADQIFKKEGTTVKPFETPSALIVNGPFRIFRHPMYIGMLSILVGISVICGSVSSVAGCIIFWVIMRVQFIPVEEKSMEEAFGSKYEEYKKRSFNWI